MSKTGNKNSKSIVRDGKIEENAKKDYKFSEIPLNSITQKFFKEPMTLEELDKKVRQMNEPPKKQSDKDNKPSKKNKQQEEKAIFYDIFVKPKENKIKEIKEKRNQKSIKSTVTNQAMPKTYISNKLCENGKILGMNLTGTEHFDFSSFVNDFHHEEINEEEHKKLGFVNERGLRENIQTYMKTDEPIDVIILNKFLHEKYILSRMSSELSKKNYFNQLIQIRPPEGINAVAASPGVDSKGWAPSIPSVNIEKLNTNLSDLMTRAKGGIKSGEITKEAHMAFYLGIMNEEEKHYENALKFYKKYFLSAKLGQDIYGTELALNRIAVLFSNIYDYKQSNYYNGKHKEITTHNLNGFVAYYNSGICFRIGENFEESVKNFETALKMSEEENDLESYTGCLAQLAISYIFTGNVNGFIEHSEEFFNKNKSLNHIEMELEMRMLSGFVYNFCGNGDVSKEFYENSLKHAESCFNERSKAVSGCNIGIIEANKDIDAFFEELNEEDEEK